MAVRFRKSVKIAPGVRLNISKSGVSTSVGGKGLTANLSKRGTRVTAGIPGSGLSASQLYKGEAREEQGISSKTVWIAIAVTVFVVWLVVG